MLEPLDYGGPFIGGGGQQLGLLVISQLPPRDVLRVKLGVSSSVEVLLSLLSARTAELPWCGDDGAAALARVGFASGEPVGG